MSQMAIRAAGLSKRYPLGGPASPHSYRTFRQAIVDWIARPFSGAKRTGLDAELWALRDVTFEVRAGEAIGIIGRNGAGKSTLLKILCRITHPTGGRAEIRGRVGSLLEVGTGFHPELSGRENVYLNGAILGMRKLEMDRKFDDIVAFAEVERFIDVPIKHYSTGMYARLAFAVAAHLEPEILFVDEVLAVGDASFQKRSMGKMGDLTRQGRTVIFVSHNMAAVQGLCTRAIWLDGGRVAADGDPGTTVSTYLATSFAPLAEQVWIRPESAPGNDNVRLGRVAVRAAEGTPGTPLTVRTPLVLEFEYWNLKPDTRLNLSVRLYDEQSTLVLNTAPVREPLWHGRPFPRGHFRSTCRIPGDLLNDGLHRVDLLVVKDEGTIIHRQEGVLVFDVQDSAEMRGSWHGKWPGAVRPDLLWTTHKIDEAWS